MSAGAKQACNNEIGLSARQQRILKTGDLETQGSGERGQPPTTFCRLYVVLLGDLISNEQLEIYIL